MRATMITRKDLKRQLKLAEYILRIRRYDDIEVTFDCPRFSDKAAISISGWRTNCKRKVTVTGMRKQVFDDFANAVLDEF